MLKHGRDPVPCKQDKVALLKCDACPEGVYKENILPTTVPALQARRDTSASMFYMFVLSTCPHFPETMPTHLQKVMNTDSITPVLILVDDYSHLPDCRKRLAVWGWQGPVYILDQDHYGCFYDDDRARDQLVLEEFEIHESRDYNLTVTLEIMVNSAGQVTGYSNWNDLPGELRGKNLPQY